MSAQSLERRTRNYLSNNVPQIQEHGGHFEIEDVDDETGEVTIAIGGACSGCGIAPMTMKAIKQRIATEVDDVSEVTVRQASG
ncbi:NifU family protein, partial [Haloferax volcanii]